MGSVDALGRLEQLRAGAAERSPDVRTLARFASTAQCRVANLGFAARVDFDKLLLGTRFAAPFGQSPFAFRRGLVFEERLRADGHQSLFAALGEALGQNVVSPRPVNLRERIAGGKRGMAARATATEEVVADVLSGRRGAPNLLDGAVLTREVCGVPAYFEADAVLARVGEPLHAGEIKSFPTVDGQADADKLGAAVAQVAIYVLLLRELAARLGRDADAISNEALIITAKNTGLQPAVIRKPVAREVQRAARLLAAVPNAPELAASLSSRTPTFGSVSDPSAPAEARIERAETLLERVGTHYQPECLAACGLSRLCRQRAHRSGSPDRMGASFTRLVPGVPSLDRLGELAAGAPPKASEASVAEQVALAAHHLDELVPVPALVRNRRRVRP